MCGFFLKTVESIWNMRTPVIKLHINMISASHYAVSEAASLLLEKTTSLDIWETSSWKWLRRRNCIFRRDLESSQTIPFVRENCRENGAKLRSCYLTFSSITASDFPPQRQPESDQNEIAPCSFSSPSNLPRDEPNCTIFFVETRRRKDEEVIYFVYFRGP